NSPERPVVATASPGEPKPSPVAPRSPAARRLQALVTSPVPRAVLWLPAAARLASARGAPPGSAPPAAGDGRPAPASPAASALDGGGGRVLNGPGRARRPGASTGSAGPRRGCRAAG